MCPIVAMADRRVNNKSAAPNEQRQTITTKKKKQSDRDINHQRQVHQSSQQTVITRREGIDTMPGPVFPKQTHYPSPHASLRGLPASPHNQHTRNDSTGTFTPKFINALSAKDARPTDAARDLAEFSGKRWVWLKDEKLAFVKGGASGIKETIWVFS